MRCRWRRETLKSLGTTPTESSPPAAAVAVIVSTTGRNAEPSRADARLTRPAPRWPPPTTSRRSFYFPLCGLSYFYFSSIFYYFPVFLADYPHTRRPTSEPALASLDRIKSQSCPSSSSILKEGKRKRKRERTKCAAVHNRPDRHTAYHHYYHHLSIVQQDSRWCW